MKKGLEGADVVMMLRLQKERMDGAFIPSEREYYHRFGLDAEKLAFAKEDAIVMHPGPMNRGVEIDGTLADDINRSVIQDQVEMGWRCAWPAWIFWRGTCVPSGAVRPWGDGMSLLLTNARLIDPEGGTETEGDLLIEGGLIAAVGALEPPPGAEVIDCGGKCLAPASSISA